MKPGTCLIKTLISFVILAFFSVCIAGTVYFFNDDFRESVNSFFESANNRAERLDQRLEKAGEKIEDAHKKHMK